MLLKIKKHLSTIILVLVMIVGAGLVLYPTVSDYWNSLHQSRAIASYVATVDDMDETQLEQIWADAVKYNNNMADRGTVFKSESQQLKEYEKQLKSEDTDIMSYIEIPKIGCELPIYHGTDEAVLQVAVGHLEWSSLPVGGQSSHCVISGHRGLPSAELFTDIDQLIEGDIFMLHTLGKTLTYEVDQIRTVLPEEVQDLEIEEGKDYCTLVTCTPYGVNTHRMLVRGHRIENIEAELTTDASQIDPMLVASIVTIAALLVILIWLLISMKKKKRKDILRR